MQLKLLVRAASLAGLATMVLAAQDPFHSTSDATPPTTSTVTSVTGTIAQVNYGSDGNVDGFLTGATTLLTFRNNVSGGLGTLGVTGNSITYSGTAYTYSTGFVNVIVTSFTNNTTKATYSSTTTTTPTAYGPTSGTIKQLNYAQDGTIEGFLFTPASSTTAILVDTGSAGATLKTLLTVGATVSVTGTVQGAVPTSACVATGTLEAVQAATLVIGSQTIVIAGGNGGGSGPGPRGH